MISDTDKYYTLVISDTDKYYTVFHAKQFPKPFQGFLNLMSDNWRSAFVEYETWGFLDPNIGGG